MSKRMWAVRSARPIDKRFRPPVKGIDLAQALNFIELEQVGIGFIYDHYTGARLPYVPGSRPELEDIAKRLVVQSTSPLARVRRIARYVAHHVRWAGYYQKETGRQLPTDRGATEEEIIRSQFGWCNEQARVFCALTQAAGIPSRIVFACNKATKYGHVVSEVLLPEGWLVVDQSFPCIFMMRNKPVRACDLYHRRSTHAFFAPRYRKLCRQMLRNLGESLLRESFRMALAEDPLDGFKDLGYHNHFV